MMSKKSNPKTYRGRAVITARLIMPVASMYRSTHLEIQLLSPPLKFELGFVTHLLKHLSLTVCTTHLSPSVHEHADLIQPQQ